MRSGGIVDLSDLLDQPGFLHCADLIQHNLTRFSLESGLQTGEIGPAFSGHRCHDDSIDVMVHLFRGNDEARACLADFTNFAGIETHEKRRRTGKLPHPVFPIPLGR
jgi:hypothetical protein